VHASTPHRSHIPLDERNPRPSIDDTPCLFEVVEVCHPRWAVSLSLGRAWLKKAYSDHLPNMKF